MMCAASRWRFPSATGTRPSRIWDDFFARDRDDFFGRDREATRAQMERFFSPRDIAADEAMAVEIGALRADLAPAWLAEPGSVEETADRYIRPQLQSTFIDLVRGSVADYLSRFGFKSELLTSMYAVTDGLSGLTA